MSSRDFTLFLKVRFVLFKNNKNRISFHWYINTHLFLQYFAFVGFFFTGIKAGQFYPFFITIYSCLGVIERYKFNSLPGIIFTELEIAVLWIDEKRICNDRLFIKPQLFPFG